MVRIQLSLLIRGKIRSPQGAAKKFKWNMELVKDVTIVPRIGESILLDLDGFGALRRVKVEDVWHSFDGLPVQVSLSVSELEIVDEAHCNHIEEHWKTQGWVWGEPGKRISRMNPTSFHPPARLIQD